MRGILQCRTGGRPKRGRGGGRKRAERLPKTAADLDAEMEVRLYMGCYRRYHAHSRDRIILLAVPRLPLPSRVPRVAYVYVSLQLLSLVLWTSTRLLCSCAPYRISHHPLQADIVSSLYDFYSRAL